MTTVELANKIIALEVNPEQNRDEIRRLTSILVSSISSGKIKVDLQDEEGGDITRATLNIFHGGIYLHVDGYSDYHTQKNGEIAKIEIYNGDLRILNWTDICQEDVTSITFFGNALISKK